MDFVDFVVLVQCIIGSGLWLSGWTAVHSANASEMHRLEDDRRALFVMVAGAGVLFAVPLTTSWLG